MILALDIATVTGVAWGGRDTVRPFSSVIRLPEGDYGRAIKTLRASVMGLCMFHKPEIVAIEMAIDDVDWQHGKWAAYYLTSLGAVAHEAALASGARVAQYPISSWRETFLGTSRLPGKTAKVRCMEKCKELGWLFETHDAAEAFGVWAHAMSKRYVGWKPNTRDLFAEGQ